MIISHRIQFPTKSRDTSEFLTFVGLSIKLDKKGYTTDYLTCKKQMITSNNFRNKHTPTVYIFIRKTNKVYGIASKFIKIKTI